MPYSAEISRTNPSCLLFLIDQSGSMEDPFGGEATRQKAEGVADAINRLLQNLVIKCAKAEGVRDYYHVGVIGYGENQVRPGFGGQLAGEDLLPISAVAAAPARVEERTKKVDDGAGGLVDQKVKFPVWFDPAAKGGTPMCGALTRATAIVEGWLAQHPDCFPPIVVNISDGESTDGDPSSPAEALRRLSSSDGGVLLFNCHLSSQTAAPIEFPADEDKLPDEHGRRLFTMSSPLPDYMREIAEQEGYPVADGARGFAFNADIVAVIRFLDIGTRPSNLR
jgi:hypothetical protein